MIQRTNTTKKHTYDTNRKAGESGRRSWCNHTGESESDTWGVRTLANSEPDASRSERRAYGSDAVMSAAAKPTASITSTISVFPSSALILCVKGCVGGSYVGSSTQELRCVELLVKGGRASSLLNQSINTRLAPLAVPHKCNQYQCDAQYDAMQCSGSPLSVCRSVCLCLSVCKQSIE
jgi:hypothetical protein